MRHLKMLPVAAPVQKPAISYQRQPTKTYLKTVYVKAPKPEKKRKKRKGFFRKFSEEAFDLVEDIFD